MRNTALLLAAAITLASCGGGNDGAGEKESEGLAKGQTVASVNGKDVTVHELNAELVGVAVPQGEGRKQVEQAALQSVISRTILADIARERGLDKSPTYMMQRRRANEALLVQLLQSEIASKIPPPTSNEATQFIAQNANLFANRKIHTLDQIQFPAPQDVAKLREFGPLQTMEQVERKLIEDRIEYRRGAARLDTVGMDPNMVRQIEALPPGEVFLVPNRGVVLASRITSSQTVPFTGEPAINYAMNLIQRRKMAEATERELKAKIDTARGTIKYQSGYAPPKPPAGQAPKAGTPKAGTAAETPAGTKTG